MAINLFIKSAHTRVTLEFKKTIMSLSLSTKSTASTDLRTDWITTSSRTLPLVNTVPFQMGFVGADCEFVCPSCAHGSCAVPPAPVNEGGGDGADHEAGRESGYLLLECRDHHRCHRPTTTPSSNTVIFILIE